MRNLRDISIPPLLAALAQATGDRSLLRADLAPDPARKLEPHGGLNNHQQDEAVALAEKAIAYLAAGNAPLAEVDEVFLREIMEFSLGTDIEDQTFRMLREELALPGEDMRAPDWSVESITPGRILRALIIGAGMSGIACAHRLMQAGIEVELLERGAGVGGTWRENRYPGCRVDVPNHLYSYSFAARTDWRQQFSAQPVLLKYFEDVARDLEVTERVSFGVEVIDATWDEAQSCWHVRTRDSAGLEQVRDAEILVSAVGQLHRPMIPDFKGIERFAGPNFHTAEWDESVDLDGKKVLVVGAAASAVQCVPEIAKIASSLSVFQRTPNWFLPAPNYLDDIPTDARNAFMELPYLRAWYRLWLFWRLSDGLMAGTVPGPGNDLFRAMFTGYLMGEYAGHSDLYDAVLPQYPPFAKRVVLDDGSWARALTSEHVELVTASIESIDETGIFTSDGRHHQADAIIWATGFEASQFLAPMQIYGRDGADLRARWGDDARAYLGVTVPDFPNLFCLYGPNTNLVANGSIIFFSECEVNHVLDAVRVMLEAGASSIDCKPEVCAAYNDRIDAENDARVWGQASVSSWYRNKEGRVTQNWPGSLEEFWSLTRQADPADYRLR